MKKITIVLILVCVAALGWALYCKKTDRDSSAWYAVRLTGGQVYVGHLTSVTDDTLVLSDAYYIEAYTPPTLPPSTGKSLQIQTTPQPIYSVARPNTDILASDNVLSIDRRVVLLWQKLKEESQVVQLIREDKQQHK